jgi:hypothetical protein
MFLVKHVQIKYIFVFSLLGRIYNGTISPSDPIINNEVLQVCRLIGRPEYMTGSCYKNISHGYRFQPIVLYVNMCYYDTQ